MSSECVWMEGWQSTSWEESQHKCTKEPLKRRGVGLLGVGDSFTIGVYSKKSKVQNGVCSRSQFYKTTNNILCGKHRWIETWWLAWAVWRCGEYTRGWKIWTEWKGWVKLKVQEARNKGGTSTSREESWCDGSCLQSWHEGGGSRLPLTSVSLRLA